MQKDQFFLLFGILGLNVSVVAVHALRSRITLAPVFALAGVYSMMLWQIMQMGWWVDYGEHHFNAGLVAFIPPILMGALLCFALDGLRTSRAYLLVVLTTSIASWGFSLFREQLTPFVPLPYSLALSNREHLSIILGLVASQISSLLLYQLFFTFLSSYAMIPSLAGGVAIWLAVFSFTTYGWITGNINLANELPEFMGASFPGLVFLAGYAGYVKSHNLIMPYGSIWRLLIFWRSAQANAGDNTDNIVNARQMISELQLLNNELKQKQQIIDDEMELSPLGILFLDAQGRIEKFNPAAGSILSEASIGPGVSLATALKSLGVDDFTPLELARSPETRVFNCRSPDGSERWIEVLTTVLMDRDRNRSPVGFHVILKDITIATQAQRRSLMAHRVSDLHVTGRVLSHDFSNLLLGAQAQVNRILSATVDSGTHDAALAIGNALNYARELLHHLGTGSQFGTPILQPVNLEKLLADAVSITEAAAVEAGVTIRNHIAESLPSEGDSGQLIRVFTNLIRNAIRACEARHGYIDIHGQHYGQGIKIDIIDSGTGMTDEQLEVAFDPGFSTKGQGQGGLGLAISYLMIDAHGGTLSLAHAQDGPGICVSVWMPVGIPLAGIQGLRGMRVIVLVRDERLSESLIVQLETQQACEVAEARSSDEAMAIFGDEDDWQVLIIDTSLCDPAIEIAIPKTIEVIRLPS